MRSRGTSSKGAAAAASDHRQKETDTAAAAPPSSSSASIVTRRKLPSIISRIRHDILYFKRRSLTQGRRVVIELQELGRQDMRRHCVPPPKWQA